MSWADIVKKPPPPLQKEHSISDGQKIVSFVICQIPGGGLVLSQNALNDLSLRKQKKLTRYEVGVLARNDEDLIFVVKKWGKASFGSIEDQFGGYHTVIGKVVDIIIDNDQHAFVNTDSYGLETIRVFNTRTQETSYFNYDGDVFTYE